MSVRVLSVTIVICSILLASCGGGGSTNPPQPPAPSDVLAIEAGGNSARIYAAPGSADGGALVRVTSGGTGQSTAATDGSFSFDATLAAPAVSQAGELTVEYLKGGFTVVSTATLRSLDTQVTSPLFSTGAGPNDMLYGNDSLYVANSLDNTVVRYSLDGSELARLSFPEFASPSYLALGGNALWVVANGNNTVTGVKDSDLSDLSSSEFLLTSESAAFIGPGQPIVVGTEVFVPRAEIESFGKITQYGTSLVSRLDFGSATISEITLSGKNAQHLAHDNTLGLLYAVCVGPLQFAEDFTPVLTSNSVLEMYDLAAPSEPVFVLNLGSIGAGRIALSRNGQQAYLGNALNGNLYLIDMAGRAILRGGDNPIVLTEEFTFISDVAYTPDGRYVLATSFNTDELYVIDSATGEVNPGPYPAPFDLSLAPDLLAGCANVEVAADPARPGKYAAFVLYGVGNAVAKVELY